MNLCIDQGNSRIKIALFLPDGKMHKSFIYRQFKLSDVQRLLSLYEIESSIISSVGNIDPAIINMLSRQCKQFILFDHLTPIPIKNAYDTPETLGQDRLAAAIGANRLFPNENTLIIDAGTAITYDYVDSGGVYQGGNIAPGIKMRLRVLHTMTKRLPQVEVDENQLIPMFGKNTADAITAGVIRGISHEARGYMRYLEERELPYRVILTGGHANFIARYLPQPYVVEKDLVLIGLNSILTYSEKAQK